MTREWVINRPEGPALSRGSYGYYRSRKVSRVKISRIYEETCRIPLVAAVIVQDVSPPVSFIRWQVERCRLLAAVISLLGFKIPTRA